ncbi:hypothetical protein F3K02_00030 [Hydrogenophaga sp. D2P1]|uniref:Translation initiation factor IF-2 n=1 Tax=Hydrogenophaga aromaticivorans TaxID=2610898 RepID=A0A7Y8GRQ2_9BURK|nr:hypothetical protein [Hydrogenophaga aromaticivorans]NWF43654.1 hypothetical protein [Hydrogenophaga aromaticivorans]
MTLSRWTSGLGLCALLCLQAQSALAAEPERPPVRPRETPVPALLSSDEVPPGMALPYGAGYEQRLRAAGSQNGATNHAASGASQGAGASRGGSGSGSGGSGGRGNGGAGRGR